MDGSERHRLLARIKALFAKTVEAGATESEAMAAAEKARELIERYQIDLGAEEVRREGFVKRDLRFDHLPFAFARRILGAVELFCEVRGWIMTAPFRCITVLGLASDVELAAYLLESLTIYAVAGADRQVAAERQEAAEFGDGLTAADTKYIRRSHLLGCAHSIRQGMHDAVKQRATHAHEPGSYGALVKLDKPALIDAEMERLNIRLSTGRGLYGVARNPYFDAGAAHGAKASFGRPVARHIAGMIGRG